jgi:hypothetical protein
MHGGKGWVLVPEEITVDEVATLDLVGEIDGNLPSSLLQGGAPLRVALSDDGSLM